MSLAIALVPLHPALSDIFLDKKLIVENPFVRNKLVSLNQIHNFSETLLIYENIQFKGKWIVERVLCMKQQGEYRDIGISYYLFIKSRQKYRGNHWMILQKKIPNTRNISRLLQILGEILFR